MEAHEQLNQLISLNEEITETYNQETAQLTRAFGLWGTSFGGWMVAQFLLQLPPLTTPGIKEFAVSIIYINNLVSHVVSGISHSIAYSILSTRSDVPASLYEPLSNIADFIGSHDTFHEVFLLGTALLGAYYYSQHVVTATKLEDLYKMHNRIAGSNLSFSKHQDIMRKTTSINPTNIFT